MSKRNNLSRSLVPLNPDITLIAPVGSVMRSPLVAWSAAQNANPGALSGF